MTRQPQSYYLIERVDRGVPEWLAWRVREERTWTTNASHADRYQWLVQAGRDAGALSATTGLTLTVTEHHDVEGP